MEGFQKTAKWTFSPAQFSEIKNKISEIYFRNEIDKYISLNPYFGGGSIINLSPEREYAKTIIYNYFAGKL